MTEFMRWNECEEGFIKKVEIDPSKIKSIINITKARLKDITDRKIHEKNVSFVIEGYYEIIKELLIALLLSRGLRSKNHQCLITYFYKNYPEYESESHLIAQLSYLRNRLDYYGEVIELEFYEKNKKEIIKTIDILNKLLEKEL